jgi:1-acyl-sn-glycerol-3-phosphate acyltransferase
MARRDIDKWTIFYWILQVLWAWPNFRLYYKKIRAFNKSNIPKNQPLIVAPNHQNALMDALAFVTQLPTQRIFLTRADVFSKPFIERILYLMKMLPIYRIRDGRASLQKNEEVFNSAVQIVHNAKCPLYMFPEGNHGDKRRLRPLVKGIFRIAFMAQEKYRDKPGVKILPAGLDYEHYQKFNKELFINYGTPIEVCEYWNEYEQNPVAATNALRERLSAEMKKVMIDISNEEYYETYQELRDIYRPTVLKKQKLSARNLLHKFKADKAIIQKLDETLEHNKSKIESIHTQTQHYIKLREKLNLREWVFRKKKYSILLNLLGILLSIVLSPVLIFGLINNWPNFFLPIKVAKGIKDTQFKSTAALGTALVMQFIYYPILIVLGFIYFPELWMKLVYIPLIPLSIKAAWTVWRLFIKSWIRIKFTLQRKHNKKLLEAISMRAGIIAELNSLFN